MPEKQIMFTITRQIDEFLERMVEKTGIDRSNLIRMRLWDWMQEERDRSVAERQLRRKRDDPGASTSDTQRPKAEAWCLPSLMLLLANSERATANHPQIPFPGDRTLRLDRQGCDFRFATFRPEPTSSGRAGAGNMHCPVLVNQRSCPGRSADTGRDSESNPERNCDERAGFAFLSSESVFIRK